MCHPGAKWFDPDELIRAMHIGTGGEADAHRRYPAADRDICISTRCIAGDIHSKRFENGNPHLHQRGIVRYRTSRAVSHHLAVHFDPLWPLVKNLRLNKLHEFLQGPVIFRTDIHQCHGFASNGVHTDPAVEHAHIQRGLGIRFQFDVTQPMHDRRQVMHSTRSPGIAPTVTTRATHGHLEPAAANCPVRDPAQAVPFHRDRRPQPRQAIDNCPHPAQVTQSLFTDIPGNHQINSGPYTKGIKCLLQGHDSRYTHRIVANSRGTQAIGFPHHMNGNTFRKHGIDMRGQQQHPAAILPRYPGRDIVQLIDPDVLKTRFAEQCAHFTRPVSFGIGGCRHLGNPNRPLDYRLHQFRGHTAHPFNKIRFEKMHVVSPMRVTRQGNSRWNDRGHKTCQKYTGPPRLPNGTGDERVRKT